MAIIIFSVLGSALAMFFCMMLDDLKQVIAYSRIGHIGLVVGTVMSDNEVGILRSLLIMVGHGFTSSLMFYLGNEAYMLRGSRSLALTKGLIMVRPAFSLIMGGVLILNISFPPSINVFGEITAMMSMVRAYPSRVLLVLLLVLLFQIVPNRKFCKSFGSFSTTAHGIICNIEIKSRNYIYNSLILKAG